MSPMGLRVLLVVPFYVTDVNENRIFAKLFLNTRILGKFIQNREND